MPETLAPDARTRSAEAALPRRSPRMIGLFSRYVRWYLPRHFRAVRVAKGGGVPYLGDAPAVFLLNHPSWWDPLICLVLSEVFPGREHYAPIDAASLEQYRFFARLGFFGVERDRFRGARQFLRVGRAILDRPGGTLWITAQGRFVDPRERPTTIEPGLGHLLAGASRGVVVPLAIEPVFWDERLPEALARFGRPVPIGPGDDADAWTSRLERALQDTQDALAEDARRRDPSAFETLLEGQSGVTLAYDLWRRIRPG